MVKRMLEEFIESQKVSEVSNTSPNARICETATLRFASRCSLVLIYLIHLAADFMG